MMFIFCSVLGALLLNGSLSASQPKSNVKLVIAIFRHGDRTVDPSTLYPLDPYLNETYPPFGLGQLTSRGKQREYEIGLMLRRKYNNFLGEIYFPGDVEAISTDVNRTKASLMLVLGGLYRPAGTQLEWNRALNWDPIPYNYVSFDTAPWLTWSIYFCPNYANQYDNYLNSTEGLALLNKYSTLFKFLSDNTGLNIQTPLQAWLLYSCLQCESEWPLKLPSWTKSVFPEVLEHVTVDALRSFVATQPLKQLSGGFTVKRMIELMKAKLQNNINPPNLKLALWSAHDINIAYLSGALNQAITHSVPYGAYYIVELVEIREVDYVLIYTIDYITLRQVPVRIPGCEMRCPFQQFVRLLEPNLPSGDNPCGTDQSYLQKYENTRNYYMGQISSESIQKYFSQIAFKAKSANETYY